MSKYESHHLEDRELPFIYQAGTVRPKAERFGSSNWHENVEVIYVVEGNGAISNNGQTVTLRTGDVAVVNSNHLHALGAGERPMQYRYLIVDRSFCLANGFDSTKRSFQARIDDARIRALMEALQAAYALDETAPLRTLTIRTLVLRLVLLLCREYSTRAEQDHRHERGVDYIKQAIDYIRAACDRDLSLDEVAAFVGISSCYLSREFHRYTGYPFVAYVNRTRCQRARQLLADGRLDVQTVGKRCGFENPSYFARSFRRYVGQSPAEYRRTHAVGVHPQQR